MNPLFKNLRGSFVTGIIILLPLGITIIVVNFLIQKIGTPTSELFFGFIDGSSRSFVLLDVLLKLLSTLIVILLITALGIFSKYFLGKLTIRFTEYVFSHVPFINTVYKTIKQIVQTFSEQNLAGFQKVVLVTFPVSGTYAIGFLTGYAKGEIQDKTKDTIYNVFVPTTPNPTSGFLVLVPDKDIIYLDMCVSDAMKLIISGGTVTPPSKKDIDPQAPSCPNHLQ